ncbi:MAG TPA: DUF1674 domain-containing protein [Gammaproteobacteria bacterium]|nr:DUF1674 domain-containing protein [Gammaproteobacteria bacterium]
MPDQRTQEPREQSRQEAQPGLRLLADGQRENTAGHTQRQREIGGPKGLEPTRYGDWERAGRCIDF